MTDRKVVEKRIGVSPKSGQKRKNSVLTAKPKRKVKRRRSARSAFAQEKGEITPGILAVSLPTVTGSSGDEEWDAAKGGLNDVMMVDVWNGTSDCGVKVVEDDRKADLIKELEFQKSPYTDPNTREERNFIVSDIALRGVISPGDASGPRLEISIVDTATGKTLGTRSATLPKDWNDAMTKLGKAVSEDVCKLSDIYTVTLNVGGEGRFATHSAVGTMTESLRARRTERGKSVWRAEGPLQWRSVIFTSRTDCPYIDVLIPVITWSVTITDAGDGQLRVTSMPSASDSPTASVDCPPDGDDDPPPIPGQPGPGLVNTGPGDFLVPYAGGTQALSGVVESGGDGFFNSGTIKVERGGIG
ncbi:MAG: hypothetical protein QOI10_3713 [Solirubrobacterales bacterium]|nr:hypothetical protein [Solirubrobacterales bacterium]